MKFYQFIVVHLFGLVLILLKVLSFKDESGENCVFSAIVFIFLSLLTNFLFS